MKINTRKTAEANFKADVLVVPMFQDEGAKQVAELSDALEGYPEKMIKSREFTGELNQCRFLHTYGKIKAGRVLFVGLGKRSEIRRERVRQAGGSAASALSNSGIKSIGVSTLNLSMINTLPTDFLEGVLLSLYRFDRYKSEKKKSTIANLTLLTGRDLSEEIKWVQCVVGGVHLARDLVNTPANDMTPSALLKAAQAIKGLSIKVIDRKEAARLGMNAYLAVAKGSKEEPKFIVASYKGTSNEPPIVLIGKSITFDSGGLSLKPSGSMETMKYDMGGGAAVLGTLKAATELGVPHNLVGILPATENMPSGTATRPGDVVKTITGKTVEILNTDAEGRLALADALGYAQTLNPAAIIDLATLTGAVTVALGDDCMAMMTNNRSLMNRIEAASEASSELVWEMPLFEQYRDYIKSDVADIKNISTGRSGSLVTSGTFLKEFTGWNPPWVHLDIASTAWTDKPRPYCTKGATGIGVRLLMNFLRIYESSAIR